MVGVGTSGVFVPPGQATPAATTAPVSPAAQPPSTRQPVGPVGGAASPGAAPSPAAPAGGVGALGASSAGFGARGASSPAGSFGRKTMVGVAPGPASPPAGSGLGSSPGGGLGSPPAGSGVGSSPGAGLGAPLAGSGPGSSPGAGLGSPPAGSGPGSSPGAGLGTPPRGPAPPVSPFKATVPVLSSLKALAPGTAAKPGPTPRVTSGALAPTSPLSPVTPGIPTRPLLRPPTPLGAIQVRPPSPAAARERPDASPTPAETPSDFPAALGALEESDLPVISGGHSPGDAPSDLPVIAGGHSAGKPPSDLPMIAGGHSAGKPPSDLPMVAGGHAARKPPSDLPVIASGQAAGKLSPGKPPVVAYRPPPAAAPPAARPAPSAPSVPPTALDDLDFDLPSLPDDLPAARARQAPGVPAPSWPSAPSIELDLPVAASNLPAARGPGGADLPSLRAKGPPAPGPRLPAPADVHAARASADEARTAAFLSDLPVIAAHGPGDVGLPVVSAGLPQVTDGRANLPIAAASLPVPVDPRAHLPSPQASLPVRSEGNLPSPAATLPVPLDSLPAPSAGGGRGFGEIELPTFGDTFATAGGPPTPPPSTRARAPSANSASFGLFGEIDLPHESPPSSSNTPIAAPSPPPVDSADFGDLELEDRPRSIRPPQSLTPPIPRSDAPKTAGGMSFGEVDISSAAGAGAIGLEADDRLGRDVAREAPVGLAAASAPARTQGAPPRAADAPRKPSLVRSIGLGVAVLAVLGGAALQLTPYGAFGYVAASDLLHASDYRQAAVAAITDTDKASAGDTYDVSKAALDAVYAAQVRAPRARSLAAYAAFADYATTVRFGADTSRASRAQQLLSGLPADPPVQYADAATAAQAAAGDDLDRARKALDAAIQRSPAGDALQRDLALLQGELALRAHDGAAAALAFRRALALASDARAHFGLARSYDLVGDAASEKLEIDATLAASPGHPGALTLRVRPTTGVPDPVKALADLAVVLDGPARAKASPRELSIAYAAKAWVSLERGGATDAREAFAQAVTLDPRNVDALNGQGRLFLNEERATEALARFDTALGIDPNSVETIANDAEAKIALERLADAKQQLLAAREKFPKSIPTLILLGKVEQHLGNSDAAEADLRAAVALVDPSRPDAVLPYVALSKLLSERGQVAQGRAALDEAKKKLTPSPALERAFGEISELQGDYDGAIAHFNAALVADPRDATTHFRLGVALRRVRKFDEAAGELDKVAAVDKDYPGLALERGLLFEESGDVQKAIEQFNGALAKAPDDPDLQLRVGSGVRRDRAPRRGVADAAQGARQAAVERRGAPLHRARADAAAGAGAVRRAPLPEARGRPRPEPGRVSRLRRVGGERRHAGAARARARRDR